MALYQNCITIRGVKALRMRETAANTTIATKRRQSGRSKTQLERKNGNEPGPYPQDNYMGTARKYKKTLVFWWFWPSSIQNKHTFLWSKATPILPRSNHPSPNRGWVAQPRHQFPQAEKAQQRKPLRSQRLRLKLPKVLDWNDVHPRKLTWKR